MATVVPGEWIAGSAELLARHIWYNQLMLWIFFVYGVIFGSFANAIVWRIHEGKSIAHGRSMCPDCCHLLSVWDLVPVASWLWLRGRCRYCHKPISWQYPVVELVTGLIFAWLWLGINPVGVGGWAHLLLWLYFAVVLVILSVYDLRWMLLPDVVMAPAIAVAAVVAVGSGFTGGGWGMLASGLVGGGAFYALAAVSDGKWMGGGDIKLAALMGLVLGPAKLAVAMFLAFNVAAVVGLILLGLGRKKRRGHIPFGPFLAGGVLAAQIWGPAIIHWYLHLAGVV